MLGRYVVLDRLGEGGMGVVVAAFDPELDRKVAIKILRGTEGARADARTARLQREARALARLVHPNVVSVFDVGAFDSSVFVAMEYVHGETLAAHMERWKEHGASWQEVVHVFVDAGRGLAAAHDAGMVHRDFKPANVMVAEDGRVVVLDFGLAQAVSEQETEDGERASVSGSDVRLTRTGAMLGTPAYMSPEQMCQEPVGPASDQFSFCVALFQALHGRRPFSGDSLPKIVDSVLSGEIELPTSDSNVPRWLHRALLRGLSRSPTDRFESMDALLAALEPPPSKPSTARWWVAGTAVVVASVGGWTLSQRVRGPCEGVGEGVRAVWTQGRADELQARFLEVEGTFGAEVAALVVPKLDAYAERWANGRRGACEATRLRGVASEALLLSRELCYERSLAALDGWVTVATTAESGAVIGAPTTVDLLPSLEECESDVVDLRRADALTDPEARAEVQRIEGALERAISSAQLGRLEGVEAMLTQALADAEALGDPRLQSRALRHRARYLVNTGKDKAAAVEAIEAAVLQAEASGDDRELMNALHGVVLFVGGHAGDVDRGTIVLDRWDAVMSRNDRRPTLVRPWLLARAKLAQRARDNDGVIAAVEQLLTLVDEQELPFQADDVAARSMLATAYLRANRLDDAEAMAREALTLGEAQLGAAHPTNALTEVVFARIELDRGDDEAALAAFRRAAQTMAARYPGGNRNHAAIRNAIGRTLRALGRPEEALVEYAAGLELMVRIVGPDDLDVASFQTNVGNAKSDLGKLTEGIAHFEDALRIERLALGEKSDTTFYGAMNLASAYLDAGRLDDAATLYGQANDWRIEHHGHEDAVRAEAVSGLGRVAQARGDLERADSRMSEGVALLTPKVRSYVRAAAKFRLAKVRWALGKKAEARALCRAAIEDWESGPKSKQRMLAEAKAWLAEHG